MTALSPRPTPSDLLQAAKVTGITFWHAVVAIGARVSHRGTRKESELACVLCLDSFQTLKQFRPDLSFELTVLSGPGGFRSSLN